MRMLVLVSLAALQGPMSVASAPANGPTRAGCTITDGGGGCSNLLPANWTSRRDGDLAGLLAQLQSMPMQSAEAVQQRRAGCGSIEVRLSAPAAMLEFPDDGTQGRQVVSHVMVVQGDGDCAESRYGFSRNDNGWTSAIQFIAVTTGDARGRKGKDSDIGTWDAYGIMMRTGNDGAPVYRLRRIKSGRFVLCGQEHTGPDQVAFIGCTGGQAAHDAASHGTVGSALDDALDRVHRGGPSGTLSGLSFDPFDDPAWARCGNLGCCAAI